jgi:hypothetical protein
LFNKENVKMKPDIVIKKKTVQVSATKRYYCDKANCDMCFGRIGGLIMHRRGCSIDTKSQSNLSPTKEEEEEEEGRMGEEMMSAEGAQTTTSPPDPQPKKVITTDAVMHLVPIENQDTSITHVLFRYNSSGKSIKIDWGPGPKPERGKGRF